MSPRSHAGSHPSLLSFLLWAIARKEGDNLSSDIPSCPKGNACIPFCITRLFCGRGGFGGSAAGEQQGGRASLLKKCPRSFFTLLSPTLPGPSPRREPRAADSKRKSLSEAYNYPVCLPSKGQLGSEHAPVSPISPSSAASPITA